jgi:superfamily II DNA or RNA helicase
LRPDPSDAPQIQQTARDPVRVGDRVRVRRQRWRVTSVTPYEACAIVTLSGQDDANFGVTRSILTPFEHVDGIAPRCQPRIVRPARWRRVCRHLIANNGHAGTLRRAAAARVDILPYQLEPALAIVEGRGSRVLIADEVGLGKTIQAGLIMTELRARGAAPRILVLTPAGLRDQWADELARRFDLHFSIIDAREAVRLRSERPVGVNPWTTEPLAIASIDYIKRPEVAPAVAEMPWDMVVVDEAHHVADGTARRDAVSSVCATAGYVVLLTATPHSGDTTAFEALCAIGAHEDRLLVFRRTRHDAGFSASRRMHELRVTPTTAERQMHACLAAFVRAVWREQGRDPGVVLATSTLRKRALSSAFALLQSVRRHLERLGDPTPLDEPSQLSLPWNEESGELDSADAAPLWTIPALRDVREERSLLVRLAAAAASAARDESKIAALRRLLRRLREPLIVFTEYRDTLLHVQGAVAPWAAVIHGGLSRDERREALNAFASAGLLLATDAAGEGLNLHEVSRIVINLELPWNPMRLEQRIGRVDRIGQTRRVHAFHLIAAATSEARLLNRLKARVARAQEDIDTSNPFAGADRPAATSGRTMLCSLHEDAAAEAPRVALARRLLGGRWETDILMADSAGEGALVVFCRRHRIRRRLGRRILVITQSTLVDETGRVLASQVTAGLVASSARPLTLVDHLGDISARIADANNAGWIDRSRAAHSRFWNVRQEREQAIAQQLTRRGSLHQRGLFDRRVDRELDDHAARRAAVLAAVDGRLRAAKYFSRLTLTASRPVLVLVP